MPQETTFEQLFKSLDSAKGDFESKTQRLLELVLKLVQNNAETLAKLKAEHQRLLSLFNETAEGKIEEIKKNTNQLFVGEKMSEFDKRVNESIKKLEAKVATLKNGDKGDTGRPPTAEEIYAVLQPLIPREEKRGNEIKILQDEIAKIKDAISKAARSTKGSKESRFISGPNANAVQSIDLSSQCNGVNKTFQVPSFRVALGLHCSQFPFVYRPTIDFTLGKNQLILTAEVSAPETTQTLVLTYVK